jgi:hypothetical protein
MQRHRERPAFHRRAVSSRSGNSESNVPGVSPNSRRSGTRCEQQRRNGRRGARTV